MKTKEFEEKILVANFSYVNNKHQIIIYTKGGSLVARVNIHSQQIALEEWTYGSSERLYLLDIMTAYTLTRPENRGETEEEKRYWLQKIPVPLLGEKHGRYFCKALVPNYQNCVDIDRSQNSQFQTIFTESEIAEMDITGFQKVEVTPE